eukprot:1118463-Pyramimonas_sp.AAC.1
MDPPQHVRKWWQDVRAVLDQHPPTIIMADANARVGSEVTDVPGITGPTDSLDFNGFELQKISN